MSKRLLMYRGLPASGKTTAALAAIKNSYGLIKRVNKDDLRAMIDAGVIRECWQALGFADRIFNVGTGEEF